MNEIKPEVGMGVTMTPYSDCTPGTIIKIVSPKMVIVQKDSYKITRGSTHDGSAEYEISPDPNGSIIKFRLNKKGWYSSTHGLKMSIGCRRAYYDPHF